MVLTLVCIWKAEVEDLDDAVKILLTMGEVFQTIAALQYGSPRLCATRRFRGGLARAHPTRRALPALTFLLAADTTCAAPSG